MNSICRHGDGHRCDARKGGRAALGVLLLLLPVCEAAAVEDEPAAPPAVSNTVPSAAEDNGKAVRQLKRLSLEQLMQVEVATVTAPSKRPERAPSAPATVVVLCRRDIRLRGYSTLTDVLRDLPGMETVEHYFSESGTLVPVRGIAGNNKIIVLVNGMRVNPPGGENLPLRSDFSVRYADRIEVVYGPGSTLYGQDAISAVINVITREPSRSSELEAGADAGFYDAKEAWASVGLTFGPDRAGSLTAFVQYHDSNLSRIDKDYPNWWQDYQRVSQGAQPSGLGNPPWREDKGLNAFARVRVGDSSLQIWHRQLERSSSEGFTSQLGYLPQAQWGDRSTVVEGRNTLSISERATLDSAICYNRYEIDPNSRYVFPVPADGGASTNWFFNDFKYGIGVGFSGEETLRMEFNDTFSLLAGAMAATFDITPKLTVPGGADTSRDVVAQGGQFIYIDPSGGTNAIERVVGRRYETFAAYVEAGWQMLPCLKGIAGTRITKDTRFDDLPFTPRCALIYEATDELTFKYIFTRAYVAPASYFSDATYDNGIYLATSNPDLQPETAETHEIGADFSRRNLNLGVSLHYGREENLLVASDRATPDNIVEPRVTLPDGSGRMLVRSANGGTSRNFGIDLYGRGTLGVVSPWLAYSYVDFEEHQADGLSAGLLGISRHKASLGATVALSPRLFVTPSLVMRSTPENVKPGPLDDLLHLPYEVNLHVLFAASRNVEVFASVRNLTDHKYALGGVTGDAVPQETFSAVLGTRVSF